MNLAPVRSPELESGLRVSLGWLKEGTNKVIVHT